MTRHLTTLNLDPFLKNTVGMPSLLEQVLDRVENANTGNYPPYNIVKVDDDKYRVEVAVAGFKKDEISITVENGMLEIAGEHVETEDEANVEYEFKGISARSFRRSFALPDHMEVLGATVEDGILSIDLERQIPEALKPKQIEIK